MNGLRYGALALALTSAAAFAGCGLGDPGSPSAGNATPTTPGSSSGSSGSTTPTGASCVACQDVPLGESAHAYRMTNAQWELTTRDLFQLGVAPGLSSTFPPDPEPGGGTFGIDAAGLTVTSANWVSYQSAAEQIAVLVTGDPTRLSKILPAGALSGDTPTRLNAFLTAFLPRAYRRPVTADEITAVTTAANSGAQAGENVSLPTNPDPFVSRVYWAIASILQSPEFLYHIQVGGDVVTNGRARLAPYEIASKLAYGLWNTMPDDNLAAQAASGNFATNDGVAQVAQAMLLDPRASDAFVRFHQLLWSTDLYAKTVDGARPAFSSFYDEFIPDAIQDISLSVQQIVVENNGTYRDLMTSPIAFVNTRLAPVYGIDPATNAAFAANPGPDTFVQIAMDATRKGIMTHPGWLAYEGTPTDPSIIHRGVYLARQITCETLGSPPPAAAGKDPSQAMGATNRARVTALTKGCGDGCHGGPGGIINPMGFAFEEYDSIGMLRTTDNGQPLDLTGTTTVMGDFNGAPDFFTKLAENQRAHACYVAHWSAFLNTTSNVDVTPKFLAPALAKSLSNASVRDVITELVQTDAFLTVSRSN